MADGCNSGRFVALGLANKDAAHVCLFVNAIRSAAPIKQRINNFGTSYTTVTICSVAMCADLAKHGVIKNKTPRASFPRIAVRWHHAFVRGVFDGDGCIHVKTIAGGPFPVITLTGAPKLLGSILAWCKSMGIDRARIRKHYRSSVVKILLITSNAAAVKFRDAIYKDADVCLERKRVLLYGLKEVAPRCCKACGKEFQPRYRTKGRYCSSKCYHEVYYAKNRDVKWKRNGGWR